MVFRPHTNTGFHEQHPRIAVDFTTPIPMRSIFPVQVQQISLYILFEVSPPSSIGPQSHQKLPQTHFTPPPHIEIYSISAHLRGILLLVKILGCHTLLFIPSTYYILLYSRETPWLLSQSLPSPHDVPTRTNRQSDANVSGLLFK